MPVLPGCGAAAQTCYHWPCQLTPSEKINTMSTGGGPDPEELRQLRQQLAGLYDQLMEAGRRLERLEQTAAKAEARPAASVGGPDEASEPSIEPAPLAAQIVADPVVAPVRRGPVTRSADWSWESVVGGRWMTWLGAFSLILAIAFFIPWAWRYFLMPPWFRILMFHLVGTGLLIAGHLLHRRQLQVFSQGLAGIGIFTLFATAYAAQHLYGIWGPVPTFLECSLLTALAIVVALRTNSVAIVLLGALCGFVTPLIASAGSADHYALFTFLAFLNVALLGCAILRSWNFLKPLVLVATALMFSGWVSDQGYQWENVWSTQWFLVLHAVILLAAVTIPPGFWKQTSRPSDLFALSGTALWFIGTTWMLFHNRTDQQLALVCWGLSLLHAVLFAVTYARVTNVDRIPRVQLALAALFFTLAVPLQLDHSLSYLAITWSAQGLIFSTVGIYFRDRQMCGTALLVFGLALIRLFAIDYPSGTQPIANTNINQGLMMFLTTAVAMVAAGGLYWFIGRVRRISSDEPVFWGPAGTALLAIGNIVGMIGLTCQWDGRIVLLLWIIDAAAVWAAGFTLNKAVIRWYACGLAIVMVGARALHHADELDGGYRLVANARFGTLALMAVVYFAAGWFYRRLQARQKNSAEQSGQIDLDLNESWLDVLLGILANLVLLVAISLEIEQWYEMALIDNRQPFPDMRMARMATFSIVWAIYAASVVAGGFVLRYRLLRILGLVAFVPILLKVFLVDLGSLDLLPRVLALAVLGMMLLGVSFLYQKFTARLELDG